MKPITVINPGQSPAALNPLTSRILNPSDQIHRKIGDGYPAARALAQLISGDELEYRPEDIQVHSLNQRNIAEPYSLPTQGDVQTIIQLIKSRCIK
jgi:hypothetical protein